MGVGKALLGAGVARWTGATERCSLPRWHYDCTGGVCNTTGGIMTVPAVSIAPPVAS